MEDDAELVDKGQYQRIVGKLIYLSITRLDIAHAIGVVSQFMHPPQVHHFEAAMRIIRYLKKTPGHGVILKKNGHLETQIYTNASWAAEKGDRRSTSGFFTIVGGNLVAWRSKKQKVVSLSSAESEFREIGFSPKEAIQILCDNEAAIAISENPVQHDLTKHVEIDRHFIREKLDGEIISLSSIRSEDQLADILTKSVNGRLFSDVLSKLNIGDPTIQLEGEY
ncbi:secreted RxLR effector protein 161-like [Rutidosis leptorrhynchoides]|uniref:secreted RxLR effector protein 161-like n=1 Tax=Rutidosis leptorrhynchoides TaxID=125765 RepID=UPI003A9A6549